VTTPSGFVQPPPVIQTPTGSSSVAIVSLRDVQHALNTLAYAPSLKEDGILGPKTSANVRAFQSKAHLVVDGNAGPATKAALSSALVALASGGSPLVQAPGAAPTPQNPKPQYNDNWAAPKTPPTAQDTSASATMSLRDIQRALNLLGTTPKLAEDGKSGPSTVAAIKSFQMAHGLAADGIAGPKTKAALYQLEHAPVKQFTGEGQFSGRFC
jgi:peptidoglycan hydrolase-like protein with peptidoglycan-binding domain